MSLFVCGALHHDVIVTAPRLPRPDETLQGQAVRYAFGGKGGNQAVAAARMGARVAMAGAVGSDPAADLLIGELQAARVDASRICRLPGASGMSVAILDAKGDYGAVIVSAANAAFDPAPVDLPEGVSLILLQNELPESANLALATKARAAKARVLLNAAPARALPPDLLALADILVVNRLEAADLLGRAPGDPLRTAQILTALGPAKVIVTLGADGLALSDGGRAQTLPAHRVAALSTHGAGDMFIGALAAELDRGRGLAEAAAFAQGAAALHVSTQPEARPAIARAAVQRFLLASA